MKKISLLLLLCAFQVHAQESLTVDKIMQKPSEWIGVSPSNPFWAEDGKTLYFDWQKPSEKSSSYFALDANGSNLRKIDDKDIDKLPKQNGSYNKNRSLKVYEKNGDIFLYDLKSKQIRQLTNTTNYEGNPVFLGEKVVFVAQDNLFVLDYKNFSLEQITDFSKGNESSSPNPDAHKKWLQNQIELFEVLKERKAKREERQKDRKDRQPERPLKIWIGEKSLDDLTISPNADFVSYKLVKYPKAKTADVPNYVTESGYTENIPTRSKVGDLEGEYEFWIYDIKSKKNYLVQWDSLTGIYDKNKKQRAVVPHGLFWSEDGKKAAAVVRALDNKDRWIVEINPKNAQIKVLDRQHDEAWIGGPQIEGWNFTAGNVGWLPDNKSFWFHSEESGFSHLYAVNTENLQKIALTKGKFEVREAWLSKDKKNWYLITSEVHAGEEHLYKMPVFGGKSEQITSMTGLNQAFLSPDESQIALLYSYSNKPTELYLMPNSPKATAKQITFSLTDDFKKYNWKEPEIISFKATDGTEVFARLYQPKGELKNGAGVIFVHGAGYLQNAHKGWSSYFREYMFHNLLVDKGYTVLDIDYRASAGYGRDFRTGIYQFMGGKDLDDQVDGAKLLVEKYGVNPKKIGIYGGSYGGFITLMGMFTKPDVFAAGAALRSVTDWAHYNHPYTNNILNTPVLDSLAYTKSSPIYYAEGLKGALLICHGMIDTNVHFQDVVRLSQRLIELKKENWEMAVYPLEDHGFVEPSSWADEYKRILKLFESNLR